MFNLVDASRSCNVESQWDRPDSRLELAILHWELQVPPQWGHTQHSREIYDSCGWFDVIQLPMEGSEHTWCKKWYARGNVFSPSPKIYQSQNPLESTIQKFCSIIFHMCASPVFHHSSGWFTFNSRSGLGHLEVNHQKSGELHGLVGKYTGFPLFVFL